MKIQNNTGTGSANGSIQSSYQQKQDSQLNAIQNQINNVQKQIQNLAKENEMTAEEKMSKRKEYQQELQSLNNQMTQRKIEIQKEQREAAAEAQNQAGNKGAGNILENGKGDLTSQTENLMGAATMKGLISADTVMKQVNTVQSVKTELEGTARVLKSEIKLDKNRGLDTTKKEEALQKNNERLQEVFEDLGEKISSVKDEIDHAKEVEQKENLTHSDNEEKSLDTLKNETDTQAKKTINLEKGQYVDERI